MPYLLKNKNFEIHIDLPNQNYNFSRFDWTGKIANVKFQNISLSGHERADVRNENHFGKGFYNEFGIDNALGFDEAKSGEWFHKIGVGLLKKEGDKYLFHKHYETKPAKFISVLESNCVFMTCKSEYVNGYSYVLKKEVELFENKFKVKYYLQNTGEKVIITNEYCHNFISVNKDLIGSNYKLKFPFQLKQEQFIEHLNPERKVNIEQHAVKFESTANKPFFFSNLSGNNTIDAAWELINMTENIRIRETGNFQTNKVNLWGCKHVISPELFINLYIKPGQTAEWTRTFSTSKLNKYRMSD